MAREARTSRVDLYAAIRRDATEAAMAGYRVKYTLATKLANELVEAADEKTLSKTIARYGRASTC